MHSPKFDHKSAEFRRLVHSSILEKLWKKGKGVRDHMRRQLVPDAVEFLDFHIQHRQRCKSLEALICAGDYIPSPILRMRVEKGKGLCRQIAMPAPSDALILQALSNSLWHEIQSKAPSPTAFYAPQDQPFSKRNPINEEDEFGYGPIESWLDFQQEILKFSQTRRYIVVTDIANYYDCILHRFLRAILSDYGLEKEHALDLLLYILDAMLWRPDYMPNFGIGLPQMDLDAPRLLAHTHLFEIDRLFENTTNVDYARYMDDMDFGVDTIAKAKEVLRDLDLALHTRNIRVNSGKTKILEASEALRHFRILENQSVLALSDRIKANGYLTRRMTVYQKMTRRLIDSGLLKGEFADGNGVKILKRLLTLSNRYEFGVTDAAFRKLIYEWPGLRSNLFKVWIRSPDFVPQIKLVIGFLGSGQAVDDFVRVGVADSMVSATYDKRLSYKSLFELLYQMRGDDPFFVFARLWLISRLETRSRLMDEIRKTRPVWARHPFIARLVAGCFGLFAYSKYFSEFRRLVRGHGGPDAISVLEFHEAIANEPHAFHALKKFLEAGTPSLPNGLSHAKALMLASVLWNQNIPKSERAALLGHHRRAMHDHYYRDKFSRIISRAR